MPGDVRVDHAELAADLDGGLGLGVEAVDVADAPLEPEQDARDVVLLAGPDAALARARKKPGRLRPSAASEPTRRKLRRLTPSQLRWDPCTSSNMEIALAECP